MHGVEVPQLLGRLKVCQVPTQSFAFLTGVVKGIIGWGRPVVVVGPKLGEGHPRRRRAHGASRTVVLANVVPSRTA